MFLYISNQCTWRKRSEALLSQALCARTFKITHCDVSCYDYCQIQNGFWSLLWHYLLNSSPISPYMHILSPFSFFPYTHYLSKHVSYTLPYCFYLCSPILLLFLTTAHHAQTDCRPTSYIHCKLIYINVLYKAILYYL